MYKGRKHISSDNKSHYRHTNFFVYTTLIYVD